MITGKRVKLKIYEGEVNCTVLGIHKYPPVAQLKKKFIVEYLDPKARFKKVARVPLSRLVLDSSDHNFYHSRLNEFEL